MIVEFTDEDKAVLIDLIVGIIENDAFPLSQRVQRLRIIVNKLRPMPELPPEEPDETDDEPTVL